LLRYIRCEKKKEEKKKKSQMGYDINRFEGSVDEELICPICSQILEEPVQVHAAIVCFLL
jgi:hypothetical protein